MSEQRDFDEAAEAAESEETDAPEPQETEEEGEAEDEEEDKPAPKPVDWEKRAHSHAGQAARERSRRQAAERRSQELESRLERVERQTGAGVDEDELLAVIAQLREDDEDPVGDIASVKRALKMFRQREVQSVEEQRAYSRVERQIETLKNTMADAEADFTADHPDYRDAAHYYRTQRLEELQEAGYQGDDLKRRLADDLFGLVRTAFTSGLDPAERVYNLAKKRGFKAGKGAADKKLDALDRTAGTGVRPQARAAAGVLSWSDVSKLDGAARDKAWAALRKRETAKK